MHTDSRCPAVAVTEADGTGPGLRRETLGARAARDTRRASQGAVGHVATSIRAGVLMRTREGGTQGREEEKNRRRTH
ncbi:hypothetical protein QQF64_007040 [Cirrhinus molitorella]|uniref:Uncharacterized protein n=1 Tax=Cirrhinus molitorella TaxID=172907 RepID=A0ABR3MAZ5_9TELE